MARRPFKNLPRRRSQTRQDQIGPRERGEPLNLGLSFLDPGRGEREVTRPAASRFKIINISSGWEYSQQPILRHPCGCATENDPDGGKGEFCGRSSDILRKRPARQPASTGGEGNTAHFMGISIAINSGRQAFIVSHSHESKCVAQPTVVMLGEDCFVAEIVR